MGFDWEGLLGTGGANIEDAYNSRIPDWGGAPQQDDSDYYAYLSKLATTPFANLSDFERVDAAKEYNKCHTNYIIEFLKNSEIGVPCTDGRRHPSSEKLFYADSVITSVNFIRNKKLFSRQKGEELGIQTIRSSDELMKRVGLYNDIFFDNIDIPFKFGSHSNFHGPVEFVFEIDILKDQNVRLLKLNPTTAYNIDTLTYWDLFFTESKNLSAALVNENKNKGIDPKYWSLGRRLFLNNSAHHTSVYNTAELNFGGKLLAIYVEKHFSGSEKETSLKSLLESELRNVGLQVPVYIRENAPKCIDNERLDADYEELWKFPT